MIYVMWLKETSIMIMRYIVWLAKRKERFMLWILVY